MIPSSIENKVKRVSFRAIEGDKNAKFSKYQDEFDYLLSSGIALGAKAVANPVFPSVQSSSKNLIKLYLNDVGLLTCSLYRTNIRPILADDEKTNLGSVYETVVAQELRSHDHRLFYFDSKKVGEVDYLIDDFDDLSCLPLKIKSGRGFNNFRALPKLIENPSYGIKKGYVLSNSREVKEKNGIVFLPIYYVMFLWIVLAILSKTDVVRTQGVLITLLVVTVSLQNSMPAIW